MSFFKNNRGIAFKFSKLYVWKNEINWFQVQEKNAQLSQLQSEIESYKKSRDESDADRENEIRKFFDPSGSEHQPEADVSLENERLKNDLNQVIQPDP